MDQKIEKDIILTKDEEEKIMKDLEDHRNFLRELETSMNSLENEKKE